MAIKKLKKYKAGIHDTLFKIAMQDLELVSAFLTQFLPKDILQKVVISSLSIESKLIVDSQLNNHYIDSLFKIEFQDEPRDLFVIVEHKSKMNPEAIEQVYRYLLMIRDREYKKRGAKGRKISLYSIILHHGKPIYRGPKNIKELFDHDPIMKKMWLEGPQIIDVKRLSDAEVFQQNPLLGFMLSAFKYVKNSKLIKAVKQYIPDLHKRYKKHTMLIEGVLEYLAWVMPKDDESKAFLKRLSQAITSGESKVISLAEGWFLDGLAEGEKRGEQRGEKLGLAKTVRLMLQNGWTIEKIAELLEMEVEEVKVLKTFKKNKQPDTVS